MKHLTIPVLLAGSLIAFSTMEAGAVVCARGVVRAGCVARRRGCRRESARGDRAGRPSWRCGHGASGGRCSAQGVLTYATMHQGAPEAALGRV